jgi:hypothetical protein
MTHPPLVIDLLNEALYVNQGAAAIAAVESHVHRMLVCQTVCRVRVS